MMKKQSSPFANLPPKNNPKPNSSEASNLPPKKSQIPQYPPAEETATLPQNTITSPFSQSTNYYNSNHFQNPNSNNNSRNTTSQQPKYPSNDLNSPMLNKQKPFNFDNQVPNNNNTPSSAFMKYQNDNDNDDNIINSFHSKLKQYNSPKEFIRPISEFFPIDPVISTEINLPLGVVFSPFSPSYPTSTIPLSDYSTKQDIPRCTNKKCHAYLNPFVKFQNGSSRWTCNLCGFINNVENYYYCPVDSDGIRTDINAIPELSTGTYEFVANEGYWRKNKKPNTPNYFFLIDVSENSIASGFFQCVCESIKDCINKELFYCENNGQIYSSENKQNEEAKVYDNYYEKIKICIITYDKSIHYYPIKNNTNQIPMLVVADDEIYLPTTPDQLLKNLSEYKDKYIELLDQIQNHFLNIFNNNQNSANTGAQKISMPKDAEKTFESIKAVNLITKNEGGKILLFSCSNVSNLPMMNLKKDSTTVIKPEERQYVCTDDRQLSSLGIEITYNNLSVDVFAATYNTKTPINLLTFNQISDNSNGNIYFYKNFNSSLHYKNIYNQIIRVISRELGLEAVLKARFSHNFYIKEFITPVLLYNRELYILPCHDADQKYTVYLDMNKNISEEEKNTPLNNEDFFYIQTAFLYSRGDGTRRVRVSNYCIPLVSKVENIFKGIDPEAMACMFLQKSIHMIYQTKNLNNSIINTETKFRSMMSSYFNRSYNRSFYNTSNTEKTLPESIQNLPLYLLGIFKQRIFCRNDNESKKFDIDTQNFTRQKLLHMSFDEILAFIYPRIFCLDNVASASLEEVYNDVLPCSKTSFTGSLYLIDNGSLLILYITKNADKSFIKSLFDVDNVEDIIVNICESTIFENCDNPIKNGIMNFMDSIRNNKSLYQNVIFLFEDVNDSAIMKEILVDDNLSKWYGYDYGTFYNKIILGK